MAYGTPEAARTSRPTTRTSAGAAHRPTSSSPTSIRRYEAIGGLTAEPARRAHASAQRAAIARELADRDTRSRSGCVTPADDRGGRRPRWPPRRRSHHRPGARPALLLDVDRRLPRACRTAAARARRRVHRHRELGDRTGVRRRSWPTDVATQLAAMPAATTGRVHGALAARAGPRRGRSATRARCDATATAVATATGLDRRPAGRSRWQSPGRTPERWIGPDILTVIDELARGSAPTACSSARADSSPTISRCSTTSTSRPAGGRSQPAWRSPARASVNDDPAVMAALARLVAAA